MKADIIGAGPIGSYVAYLLARQGHEVHLYEDHAAVGRPIQCTGLMTISMCEIIKPEKEFLVNTTERVEIISPNGSSMTINAREYVVDRAAFDQHFVDKARDAGVELHTQHRFTGVNGNSLVFRAAGNTKCVRKGILVGADGANSLVSRLLNPSRQRHYLMGVQARVRGTFDPTFYRVFFGDRVSKGFFAWIVPESEKIARVGLKGTNQNFSEFLKRFHFSKIEMQAGPIPIYDPKYITEADGTFLVGDAAMQVKATTAGGLIPGLKAAECLAEAMQTGASYTTLWKNRIGYDLWLHLKIRRMLDKFSDKDWDMLLGLLNVQRVKEVLEKYDREKPFRLLAAVVKEPRLLQFCRYLL